MNTNKGFQIYFNFLIKLEDTIEEKVNNKKKLTFCNGRKEYRESQKKKKKKKKNGIKRRILCFGFTSRAYQIYNLASNSKFVNLITIMEINFFKKKKKKKVR